MIPQSVSSMITKALVKYRDVLIRLRMQLATLLARIGNLCVWKAGKCGTPRGQSYLKEILKGDNFEIGEYSYCTIPPKIFGHPGIKLKIGKFCSIAEGVVILLGLEHRIDRLTTYPFRSRIDDWPEVSSLGYAEIDGVSKGDVIIGNDVWIGYGAMILSGVRIGDGAVVGAGAVVTRDVEPYTIVAGNPIRSIRKRFDDETIRKLLEIKWWDWPIEKISKNVEIICSNDIQKLIQIK